MIARRRGHVVTIGSLAGRSAFAGGTAYTGSKHFVVGFSESLMLEVREHGIKVSVVMPGSTRTDFGSGRGAQRHGRWPRTTWLRPWRTCSRRRPNVLVSRVEMRPLTHGWLKGRRPPCSRAAGADPRRPGARRWQIRGPAITFRS